MPRAGGCACVEIYRWDKLELIHRWKRQGKWKIEEPLGRGEQQGPAGGGVGRRVQGDRGGAGRKPLSWRPNEDPGGRG